MRRPKRTLLLVGIVVFALGSQAPDLQRRLAAPNLLLSGSGAAREIRRADASFGFRMTIPILLEGPAAALDRDGPRLAGALARDRRDVVLSPWTPTRSPLRLRPSARAAMVVALVNRPQGEALQAAGDVEHVVHAQVRPPVTARVSGQAPIALAVRDANFDAAAKAERLALPMLLLVLLLVFRSPVAAAIPALCGAATVVSGFGVLSLLALVTDIQPLAVSLASMIGLALGVDYSLLMVSRFRHELSCGATPQEACVASLETGGRTVVFAGVVLLGAIAVAIPLVPGTLLLTAIVGVLIVTALSLLTAVLAIPSALALLGTRVDRWAIGRRRDSRREIAGGLIERLLRHPALTAAAILLPLLALSAPALAVDPVAPGVRELPAGYRAARDYERVSEVMGKGWGAPFELLVETRSGTIVQSGALRQLLSFQRELRRDRSVATVVGPGDLVGATAPLRDLPARFDRLTRSLERGRTGLRTLSEGLDAARTGADQLRAGLLAASAGAGALGAGSGDAKAGARALRLGALTAVAGAAAVADGLSSARAGAARLVAGTRAADDGARQLLHGLEAARGAVQAKLPAVHELADRLRAGGAQLHQLETPAGIADREAAAALAQLKAMSVGKADPHYAAAYRAVATASGALSGRDPTNGRPVAPGYDGMVASIAAGERGLDAAASAVDGTTAGTTELMAGLGRLETGASRLSAGLAVLGHGQRTLASGIDRLAGGSDALTGGVRRLATGAAQLEDGLGRLQAGSGRLSGSLASGYRSAAPLPAGIDRLHAGVGRFRGGLAATSAGLAGVNTASPGFLRSGYVTLAGLDGAPPDKRQLAQLVVSVDRGGQAGRILVVPRTGPQDAATGALADRLTADARRFSGATGLPAVVGGEAAIVTDYARTASGRLVPMIVALSVFTALLLVLVFRSLILPLVAVALNVLTVAVALGVLQLMFGSTGGLFLIPVLGIFTIVFGLSIDYEVFLISRIMERRTRVSSTDAAIVYGVRHTARVITGAAAIMTAVFLSFAVSDFHAIRQLGIGLAVAVVLDATLVRLVLLPAAMKLLGEWSWWLPRWLDRLAPRVQFGEAAPTLRAVGRTAA